MGLDMYLMKREENGEVDWSKNEIAYWRKANQIHKWFVDNVQNEEDDCKNYEVSKNQLNELLSKCKYVLDNQEKAIEILPTESGFFFGTTFYDEWYFRQLENTVQILENVLNNFDFENDQLIYSSSW